MAEFLTGEELDRILNEDGGGEVIDTRSAVLDSPAPAAATIAEPKLAALLSRVSVAAEPPPAAPAGAPMAKQLTRRLTVREREEQERDERWRRFEEARLLDEDEE